MKCFDEGLFGITVGFDLLVKDAAKHDVLRNDIAADVFLVNDVSGCIKVAGIVTIEEQISE